jgi:hypothetical protein
LFKIIKQRNLSDRNIEITLEKLLEYYQLWIIGNFFVKKKIWSFY